MFCIYCGKQTDNQDSVCDECKQKRQVTEQVLEEITVPVEQAPAARKDRLEGFGRALASIITGAISWILSCDVLSHGSDLVRDDFKVGVWAYILLVVTALGLGIFSMIFGIKSMGVRKKDTASARPAFALGIASVAASALAFLFVFLSLVIVLSVL